jgi:DNA-binding SARP family transcriptional activator
MRRPFVRLFAAPRLHADSASDIALHAERRDQLLAYLACCDRWATRDELATLFWPERTQAAARSNLRYVVLQARRAAVEGFDERAGALRWSIDSDLRDFERAIAARDWQAALDVHAGPLLDGFERHAPSGFADWLTFERARVAALWQQALGKRLEQLAGDAPACAALAARALETDSLNEDALKAYLHSQLALGDAAQARRAWRAYVERLATTTGLEPSAELRACAAPLQQAPVPTGLPRPPLAAAAPACIGRRLELAQLRELLAAPDCRLLTIVGTGGVGKSTLARAVLPSLDAATWVALEDLASIDEVAPRLAARLDLALSAGDPALPQVTRLIGAEQRLLVLDNAEHLAGIERIAAALLHDCAALNVLVTSRRRLGVAGEWLLPLDGLPSARPPPRLMLRRQSGWLALQRRDTGRPPCRRAIP